MRKGAEGTMDLFGIGMQALISMKNTLTDGQLNKLSLERKNGRFTDRAEWAYALLAERHHAQRCLGITSYPSCSGYNSTDAEYEGYAPSYYDWN